MTIINMLLLHIQYQLYMESTRGCFSTFMFLKSQRVAATGYGFENPLPYITSKLRHFCRYFLGGC